MKKYSSIPMVICRTCVGDKKIEIKIWKPRNYFSPVRVNRMNREIEGCAVGEIVIKILMRRVLLIESSIFDLSIFML
jgi:hypothetical protein